MGNKMYLAVIIVGNWREARLWFEITNFETIPYVPLCTICSDQCPQEQGFYIELLQA